MIKVTFGEHDRCATNNKPETRFVLRATPGDFSYLNFDNDIAILRLNDRVPITDTIRPICLPSNAGLTMWSKFSKKYEIVTENNMLCLSYNFIKNRERF